MTALLSVLSHVNRNILLYVKIHMWSLTGTLNMTINVGIGVEFDLLVLLVANSYV